MVATGNERRVLKQTGNDFADDCINTLRFLSMDAVEKAQSGHPGMPMGMAPTAYILWRKHMNFNPKNPNFINRDRFVYSVGHGSILLYSLLHLSGYDSVSLEDLKQFRQFGSNTPGHPENIETAGVEFTTGPLGQGICNAVGVAIAEAHVAAVYNRPDCSIIDNYTYCFMGDGCNMEGLSGEACSLAGHLGLGKLIAFYDDNKISIDGSTDITFTEDVGGRFKAYGWHVIEIPDGNTDIEAIDRAIEEAKKCTDKPSLIKVSTTIGFGSPNKANSEKAHGAALGADEITATRESLGWKYDAFEIPDKVLDHYRQKIDEGAQLEEEWNKKYETYRSKYSDIAADFEKFIVKGECPSEIEDALREDASKYDSGAPTRKISSSMLNVIAGKLPTFIGGSADLAGSNLTLLEGCGDFQKDTPEGRNIRYGVREHAMGAITTGLRLAGYNLVPFASTFFVFTDYMRAAMRVASISRAGVIYVTTHDSIFLGEDGPTHQPIEHLTSFRAMPNHRLFRPADPTETAAAYVSALSAKKIPTTLALTRQKTSILKNSQFDGAMKGMYILSDDSQSGTPDIILLGTGSETQLVEDAAEQIRNQGKSVRVVSAPCVDLFEEQSEEYKQSVLPDSVPLSRRLACEAGASLSWYKYAANFVCVDIFGTSAPGDNRMREFFGLTVQNIVDKVSKM